MYANQYCSILKMSNLKSQPENACELEKVMISTAVDQYLAGLEKSRKKLTVETYGYALKAFKGVLGENGIDVERTSILAIHDEMLMWFLDEMKGKSPATEQLYTTAVMGFYEFLYLKYYYAVDYARLTLIQKRNTRCEDEKALYFPYNEIGRIANSLVALPENCGDHMAYRIKLRNRGLLLLLADTGLRIHEAVKIQLGDIDFPERQIAVLAKGGKTHHVRFSQRVERALIEYLNARGISTENCKPDRMKFFIFTSHDKRSKNVLPQNARHISTDTGRNIVESIVREILGEGWDKLITPHTFRHFYVTKVMKATKNIKITSQLARHKSMKSTEKYLHFSNEEESDAYSLSIEPPGEK